MAGSTATNGPTPDEAARSGQLSSPAIDSTASVGTPETSPRAPAGQAVPLQPQTVPKQPIRPNPGLTPPPPPSPNGPSHFSQPAAAPGPFARPFGGPFLGGPSDQFLRPPFRPPPFHPASGPPHPPQQIFSPRGPNGSAVPFQAGPGNGGLFPGPPGAGRGPPQGPPFFNPLQQPLQSQGSYSPGPGPRPPPNQPPFPAIRGPAPLQGTPHQPMPPHLRGPPHAQLAGQPPFGQQQPGQLPVVGQPPSGPPPGGRHLPPVTVGMMRPPFHGQQQQMHLNPVRVQPLQQQGPMGGGQQQLVAMGQRTRDGQLLSGEESPVGIPPGSAAFLAYEAAAEAESLAGGGAQQSPGAALPGPPPGALPPGGSGQAGRLMMGYNQHHQQQRQQGGSFGMQQFRPMFGGPVGVAAPPAPRIPAVGAGGGGRRGGVGKPGKEGDEEKAPGVEEIAAEGEKKGGKGEEDAEKESVWSVHKTGDGAVYYYNAQTGESTYDKPPGLLESPAAEGASAPASWEVVEGTDWTVVITKDGGKYCFNSRTQLTTWNIPEDVEKALGAQKALKKEGKRKKKKGGRKGEEEEEEGEEGDLPVPAASTGGRDAHKPQIKGGEEAKGRVKKKLRGKQDPTADLPDSIALLPVKNVEEEKDPRESGGGGEEGLVTTAGAEEVRVESGLVEGMEVGDESSKEDRKLLQEDSKEGREHRFREMLKEKGIAPFSKWDKELPKILFDARYKAIPTHSERRAIFDSYVRSRAEEERREKRAAHKAAVDGFQQLLEEAAAGEELDHSSTVKSLAAKWGSDPRFVATDMKDKEALLREKVSPFTKAEEERKKEERAAAVAAYKELLCEKGVAASSRWMKVKEELRDEPRFRALRREEREKVYEEVVEGLRKEEEKKEREERAKRAAEEREREEKRRQEREEEEAEREKARARRKQEAENFRELLRDVITEWETSWSDCKDTLKDDMSGRYETKEVDEFEKEGLFLHHMGRLREDLAFTFRDLLRERITNEAAMATESLRVLTSWSEAKKLLKKDPRYGKVPRKERERLWKDHVEDLERQGDRGGGWRGRRREEERGKEEVGIGEENEERGRRDRKREEGGRRERVREESEERGGKGKKKDGDLERERDRKWEEREVRERRSREREESEERERRKREREDKGTVDQREKGRRERKQEESEERGRRERKRVSESEERERRGKKREGSEERRGRMQEESDERGRKGKKREELEEGVRREEERHEKEKVHKSATEGGKSKTGAGRGRGGDGSEDERGGHKLKSLRKGDEEAQAGSKRKGKRGAREGVSDDGDKQRGRKQSISSSSSSSGSSSEEEGRIRSPSSSSEESGERRRGYSSDESGGESLLGRSSKKGRKNHEKGARESRGKRGYSVESERSRGYESGSESGEERPTRREAEREKAPGGKAAKAGGRGSKKTEDEEGGAKKTKGKDKDKGKGKGGSEGHRGRKRVASGSDSDI